MEKSSKPVSQKKSNRLIVIIVAVIVILAGWWMINLLLQNNLNPAANPSPTPVATTSPAPANSTAYKGVGPCADCSGIEMTLVLYRTNPFDGMGTYQMTSVYQGKDVEPFVETGSWTTLRGDATNPDAVVIELYQEGTNDNNQYYLQTSPTTLQALDKQQRVIPPPGGYTLNAE